MTLLSGAPRNPTWGNGRSRPRLRLVRGRPDGTEPGPTGQVTTLEPPIVAAPVPEAAPLAGAAPLAEASESVQPTWREAFPSFRRWAVARDALASAAGGALVLLAGASPATALIWTLVLLVAIPAVSGLAGAYRWRTLGEGAAERRAIVRAGLTVGVTLMTLGYLGVVAVPTEVVFAAVPMAVGLDLGGRVIARRSVLSRRAEHGARLRTVLVGAGPLVDEFLAELDRSPGAGYDVVGWCEPPGTSGVPGLGGAPSPAGRELARLGSADEIAEIASTREIDVVVVVGPQGHGLTRRLSWSLAGSGTALVVVPTVGEITDSRISVRPTGDLWSVQLDVAHRPTKVPGKHLVDRVLGGALLALASLVLIPLAVTIRLTSPGPAFYKQRRIGRDGEPFTMWKLRSMYVDADARRAALLAQTDGNGLLFKMKDDPRITPIGKILRRLSLDELPQLINVVKGEMSLVGPRPALAEETAKYSGDEPKRLVVKPGLTGLWQVSGRSDLSREDSMRLDLRYVDNWSLGLDLAILWRTFRAVVGGRGAY